MSYQVLARKWRPQNFKQMVGQEHVLQALVHALESQRLHHAYLFTGTRGVGMTTIGRILARCLSCDTGITAEPCGECSACMSITQGRYVDLIEIDAASRTKVEDMRELLENVQYAPTEGRFKIYLIDEVHMLSTHSFNALLKTLEEPPEHVKFLFATTDPQKLPITILSRCLQFNLKNMTPERIVSHLSYVLGEENISAEEHALWAIARAADGSMRDALSLTDQAIAYSKGVLTETQVSSMLGTVDQKKVYRLIDQLLARDAQGLIAVIRDLAEYSPDFSSVLELVASIFHRVAVEQAVPGATDNSQGDQEKIGVYANLLSAEDTQLFYQIALVARKDMAITPDARSGFEMAMLRMLAFQMEAPHAMPKDALSPAPSHEQAGDAVDPESQESPVTGDANTATLQAGEAPQSETALSEEPQQFEESQQFEEPQSGIDSQPSNMQHDAKHHDLEVEAQKKTLAPEQSAVSVSDPVQQVDSPLAQASSQVPSPSIPMQRGDAADEGASDNGVTREAGLSSLSSSDQSSLVENPEQNLAKADSDGMLEQGANEVLEEMEWPRQAIRLGLSGMTQNLLFNMYKQDQSGSTLLYVESGHYRLLTDNHKKRIVDALREHLGLAGPIDFKEGLESGQETPAMWRARIAGERLQHAKNSLQQDPNVQTLIAEFDARLVEESVVALGEVN